MTSRRLFPVLALTMLSLVVVDQAAARTLPRRGAARKPRTFEIQPPFPCGTEFMIACAYGAKAHKRVNSQTSTNDHYAIDLIRNEKNNGAGKSVVAVASGTVRFAGWTHGGWAPYGKAVYIEHDFVDGHGRRYQSLYAHLDGVKVSEGEHVEAGTLVGTLGGSSRGQRHRFGPHLHFAMYRDAGRHFGSGGQSVVPEPIGGVEDLRRGMRLVACEKPAEPVAWGPVPANAVGGLTK